MFRFVRYALATLVGLPVFGQGTAIHITGTITDSAGVPIAAAEVRLTTAALTTTSLADGSFSLTSSGGARVLNAIPQAQIVAIRDGRLFLNVAEKVELTLTAYGLQGEELASIQRVLDPGSQSLQLPQTASGFGFFKIKSGQNEAVLSALSKKAATAAALYDVITVTKAGFLKAYVNVTNSDSSNMQIKLLKEGSTKFSFFVTSLKALRDLSKNDSGFGGDFRFGETGAGAGLRGADKLCAAIAERSLPGSSVKGWRAFLSAVSDANGKQVDAITRVGEGPWYDRAGRLLAPTKADLLNTRPQKGDATIRDDLPNENGIANSRPDPSKPEEDNHHFLTGSDAQGKLYGATATCQSWTSTAATSGHPRIGFSFIASSRTNWISGQDEGGCGAGVNLVETGGSNPNNPKVGSGGGYGGIYCFALNP